MRKPAGKSGGGRRSACEVLRTGRAEMGEEPEAQLKGRATAKVKGAGAGADQSKGGRCAKGGERAGREGKGEGKGGKGRGRGAEGSGRRLRG